MRERDVPGRDAPFSGASGALTANFEWQRRAECRILWGGAVAQLAEQRAFNPEVVGSIPTGPTARVLQLILNSLAI